MPSLTLSSPPAATPISATEFKLHEKIDVTADDDLITILLNAATEAIEEATWRQFVTATYTWKLDDFPKEDCLFVPRPPLQSVTSITYVDTAGATQTLSTDVYEVDAVGEPGRICLKDGQIWPECKDQLNAVTVTFVAGYGAASAVPDALKIAISQLAGHWYTNREVAISGTIIAKIPIQLEWILAKYSMKGFF